MSEEQYAGHPIGCDCEYHQQNPNLDASVDGQGGTLRDNPVFTGEQAANYLHRAGYGWDVDASDGQTGFYAFNTAGTGVLTFGFYESQSELGEPYFYTYAGQTYSLYKQGVGFSAFDADQRAATREAIQLWDDLIAVTFKEVAGVDADLAYMNTTTGPIQASAFLPANYSPAGTLPDGNVVETTELAGDVFINPNQISNHQFDEGQYGLTTLIHETGHALGLQHPGNYNFSANFTATYNNGAEYYQDSLQYSIMSYWGAEETGANHLNWATLQFVNASTPLVHDILAVQQIYGADMTTRTGDTVYGFNSTADRDAFDFAKTPLPVVAIWDAGGNDTLDLSGFDTPSLINLNQGQFSSAGGNYVLSLEEYKARGLRSESYTQTQLDNLFAKYGAGNGLLRDNIAIAYGATIENAVGGAGNDLIIGNEVNNVLKGGGGNDTLIGGIGADVLDGGEGFDTASFSTSATGVTITADGSTFIVSGDGVGDSYINIEAFDGSNFDDVLTGGNLADVLGGLGGNDILAGNNGKDVLNGGDGDDTLSGGNEADVLNGGAGNDVLNGGNATDVLNGGAGNDMLTGGNGKDTFVFADAGTDTILDYAKGETIDLSAFASDAVKVEGNKIFVDIDGIEGADLTIIVQGDVIQPVDIIFGG